VLKEVVGGDDGACVSYVMLHPTACAVGHLRYEIKRENETE